MISRSSDYETATSGKKLHYLKSISLDSFLFPLFFSSADLLSFLLLITSICLVMTTYKQVYDRRSSDREISISGEKLHHLKSCTFGTKS